MTTEIDRGSLSFDWLQTLVKANLNLSFKGEFNQDLINSILFLTDGQYEMQQEATLIKTRLFGLMVECLQNICKHGETENQEQADEGLNPGIVLIGKNEAGVFLATGNLIRNAQVEALRERLDTLKSMSAEALTSMHKKILSTTTLSDKSGAGLGLVNIARKSDKIEYSFTPLDERISFFAMEITVKSN